MDRGQKRLPLQIRINAWRSKRWIEFQDAVNRAGAAIMTAALADKDIMPVHRYRQARRAFSIFVSERVETEVVEEYKHLLAIRQRVWARALREATERCESALIEAAIVARPKEYMRGNRFLDFLKEVHIGNIRLDGRAVPNIFEVDARWDRKGMFAWQAV